MKTDMTNGHLNEQALVQLYMNLMGTTESHARSVFMFVDPAREEAAPEPGPTLVQAEHASAMRPLGQ